MTQLQTRTTKNATTILLVDDDPDARMLTCDAILQSNLCIEVREVDSGFEAMEYLLRCSREQDAPRPDLIYLDIDMPGMSGQEVLKWIRARKDLDDVPVVMVTGLDDEAQKLQAARNGANSYTLKPTNAAEFLQALHEATDYWTIIHQLPRRKSVA